MAVIFPVAMIAADTRAAILNAANDGAVVNGRSVQQNSAVFPGDRIRVANKAAVTVIAPGTQITIAPGSTLTYEDNWLELGETSGVAITTSKKMSVRIEQIRITPARDGAARFEVARAGGIILVSARESAIEISDGASTHTVLQGGTQQVPDNDSKRRRGAAGPLPAASGPTTDARAILVGLLAAGAAAAVAIGTTGAEKKISPEQP